MDAERVNGISTIDAGRNGESRSGYEEENIQKEMLRVRDEKATDSMR